MNTGGYGGVCGFEIWRLQVPPAKRIKDIFA